MAHEEQNDPVAQSSASGIPKSPLNTTSSSSESSDTNSFALIELESRDEVNPVAKEESRGDEEVFEAFEMNFIGRPVPFREANRQVDLFSPLFE